MDAERERLYRAVCDAPDDEAPRYAMAAWLMSHGDERGNFIQFQLDAAKEARYGSEKRIRLTRVADAILEQHNAEWSLPLAPFGPTYIQFVRGFPELIKLDARTFLSRASDIYRAAPVRRVLLSDSRSVVKELAAAPELARLIVIKLGDTGLTDHDLEVFLTSPHLSKLRHLDVSFNRLTDVGVDAICAAAARLPSLAYVNLAGNKLENPIEGYGVDSMSGIIVRDGCSLPERGEQLELKFGRQNWLHGPSLLDMYPPPYDEL